MLIAVTFVALAVASIQYARRDLPFDSQAWKADRFGHTTVRYRMWNDLERRLKNGEISTRENAVAHLGWPDPNTPETKQRKALNWTYGMQKPGLGFPYYVRIQFDEEGRILAWARLPQ